MAGRLTRSVIMGAGMVRGSLFGLLAIAGLLMASGNVAMALDHGKDAQCRFYGYGNPDLFRNYYVPPACGGLGAQAYVSPGPIPAHVGHTYFTYQPLMPHEFLYPHHRTYHRTYDEGRGLTRAGVHWYSPPGKNAAHHIHHIFRLAR
jgi:hypothetical protein